MRRLVAFALLGMGLSLFNCSSSSNSPGGTGGAGLQAGAPATGGTTAAGGQTSAPATGGATAAGGQTSAPATGGATAAAGQTSAPATGGATAAGGQAGETATVGTGGTAAAGGQAGETATVGTGGTAAAGGQTSAPATGGATAAGGQGGAPATGGTAGAGGHGGATASGGATGGTPAKFSLTVKLTGFAPHVGQKIVAWVYLLPAKTNVGTGTIPSLPSANDSIVIPDILVLGASYQIDLWADLSGNGTCDPPPTDHSWRLTANNITGDTTVEQVHNTTFTPVCNAAGTPTP
jgi:hypothetical protein